MPSPESLKRQNSILYNGCIIEYLFDKVRGKHEHVCVLLEGLGGSQVACTLVQELWTGHDLDDVERGPGHIVPEHLKLLAGMSMGMVSTRYQCKVDNIMIARYRELT